MNWAAERSVTSLMTATSSSADMGAGGCGAVSVSRARSRSANATELARLAACRLLVANISVAVSLRIVSVPIGPAGKPGSPHTTALAWLMACNIGSESVTAGGAAASPSFGSSSADANLIRCALLAAAVLAQSIGADKFINLRNESVDA